MEPRVKCVLILNLLLASSAIYERAVVTAYSMSEGQLEDGGFMVLDINETQSEY